MVAACRESEGGGGRGSGKGGGAPAGPAAYWGEGKGAAGVGEGGEPKGRPNSKSQAVDFHCDLKFSWKFGDISSVQYIFDREPYDALCTLLLTPS